MTPKRVLVLGMAVGVASLLLAAPAHAIRRPGSSRQIAETENVDLSRGNRLIKSTDGGYVHAISLLCTTAPCEVAIFDSNSATSGAGTLKWEGRVASNNDTYTQDFPVPIVTNNGIRVEVVGTGASAFIAFE